MTLKTSWLIIAYVAVFAFVAGAALWVSPPGSSGAPPVKAVAPLKACILTIV